MTVRKVALIAGVSLLALAAGAPTPASAQEGGAAPAAPGTAAPSRATASRAVLEADLAEAERLASAPDQPAKVRDASREEAALLKQRLQDGDLQVGDQIVLSVEGESTLSGVFTVDAGRNLKLPDLPEIPMRGVLRSEVEKYLTEQIGRYVRNPVVRASTTVRVALMGNLGKPGFYQLPADLILSEALMQAGGPPGEIEKSVVRRGDEEIVSDEEFEEALAAGYTLDQMHLRAGDEIFIEAKRPRDWFQTLRTYATIPALILSTYGVGRLVGIF